MKLREKRIPKNGRCRIAINLRELQLKELMNDQQTWDYVKLKNREKAIRDKDKYIENHSLSTADLDEIKALVFDGFIDIAKKKFGVNKYFINKILKGEL